MSFISCVIDFEILLYDLFLKTEMPGYFPGMLFIHKHLSLFSKKIPEPAVGNYRQWSEQAFLPLRHHAREQQAGFPFIGFVFRGGE